MTSMVVTWWIVACLSSALCYDDRMLTDITHWLTFMVLRKFSTKSRRSAVVCVKRGLSSFLANCV